MFLEKLRGMSPILYDSTTAQQFHVQQQQHQHMMMEEVILLIPREMVEEMILINHIVMVAEEEEIPLPHLVTILLRMMTLIACPEADKMILELCLKLL